MEVPSLLRFGRCCGMDEMNEMMMAGKDHNARIDSSEQETP
jgi:hypothetical protein